MVSSRWRGTACGKRKEELGYSSVAEYSLSMLKALDPVPYTAKTKQAW